MTFPSKCLIMLTLYFKKMITFKNVEQTTTLVSVPLFNSFLTQDSKLELQILNTMPWYNGYFYVKITIFIVSM